MYLRVYTRGSLPIKMTAVGAVLLLVVVGIYTAWRRSSADNQSFVASSTIPSMEATSTDPLAILNTATDTLPSVEPTAWALLFSNYDQMKKSGTLNENTIQQLGQNVATIVKPDIYYDKVDENMVRSDPDTSYQRMITYRDTLRTALKPLVENTTPEIDLIGEYEQTGDPSYLVQMHTAAENYRLAASNTLAVIVPSDAVSDDVSVVNSLREFGATLDAFADYATNTVTAAAVLMSYNQAEQDVVTSFSTLAQYFTSKTP